MDEKEAGEQIDNLLDAHSCNTPEHNDVQETQKTFWFIHQDRAIKISA